VALSKVPLVDAIPKIFAAVAVVELLEGEVVGVVDEQLAMLLRCSDIDDRHAKQTKEQVNQTNSGNGLFFDLSIY
jgi:hypothetical protein